MSQKTLPAGSLVVMFGESFQQFNAVNIGRGGTPLTRGDNGNQDELISLLD
jgi:hypothetical protein